MQKSLQIKAPKKKIISKTKLIKDLDIEFSKFIRYSKSYNGKCKCVTCGVVKDIKEMQCGHFISRKYYSTRWDEVNCNPQCYSCNVMQNGKQYEHSLYIDSKYGEGTALMLLKLSKTIRKYTNDDLMNLIQKYREKNVSWKA